MAAPGGGAEVFRYGLRSPGGGEQSTPFQGRDFRRLVTRRLHGGESPGREAISGQVRGAVHGSRESSSRSVRRFTLGLHRTDVSCDDTYHVVRELRYASCTSDFR